MSQMMSFKQSIKQSYHILL